MLRSIVWGWHGQGNQSFHSAVLRCMCAQSTRTISDFTWYVYVHTSTLYYVNGISSPPPPHSRHQPNETQFHACMHVLYPYCITTCTHMETNTRELRKVMNKRCYLVSICCVSISAQPGFVLVRAVKVVSLWANRKYGFDGGAFCVCVCVSAGKVLSVSISQLFDLQSGFKITPQYRSKRV